MGINVYPMPWKIQPIRDQDCRCIFCGMQRVICNGKYSTLLSSHYLRATVYWDPFEDFSKASYETLQLLRTIMNISDHVWKFSEYFRTLPKISEVFQNSHKSFKLLKNGFEVFPKFSETSRRFPSSSQNFHMFSKDLGMG